MFKGKLAIFGICASTVAGCSTAPGVIRDVASRAEAGVSPVQFLFIGDSHSVFRTHNGSRMGSIVLNGLSSQDSTAFFAACGSSPTTWIKGGKTSCGFRMWVTGKEDQYEVSAVVPRLEHLLAEYRPAVLVVEQGDNLFEWERQANGTLKSRWNAQNGEAQLEKFISLLNLQASQTQCFWVGPTLGGAGPVYHKTGEALEELYQLEAPVSKGTESTGLPVSWGRQTPVLSGTVKPSA